MRLHNDDNNNLNCNNIKINPCNAITILTATILVKLILNNNKKKRDCMQAESVFH